MTIDVGWVAPILTTVGMACVVVVLSLLVFEIVSRRQR